MLIEELTNRSSRIHHLYDKSANFHINRLEMIEKPRMWGKSIDVPQYIRRHCDNLWETCLKAHIHHKQEIRTKQLSDPDINW